MKNGMIVVVLAVVLAGCTVGPNYKRPQVAVPGTFRGGPETPSSAASLAYTMG
jgi:hypothetical protein